MRMSKTIFCDIDGTLLKHPGDMKNLYREEECVLPGTWDKIQEWHMKGYYIIIVTARMPSLRELTERQLERCGISYHQLIMGVNRGPRVIINDHKPNSDTPMAEAVNLERDEGIGELEV